MTMKSCNINLKFSLPRDTHKKIGKKTEKTNYKLPQQTLLTNLR